MNISLFFGSFNPIHVGHLIIANHIFTHTDSEQIWFVISPQNPFKKKKNLLNQYDRLKMVELATIDNSNLIASNIEFNLPKPSYTIDTLMYLKDRYPSYTFSLIMGYDNLKYIHKWKNANIIMHNYTIWVYKRQSDFFKLHEDKKNIHLLDTPLLDISSSLIREYIQKNKSIQYLVHPSTSTYIYKNNLYI